MIKGYSSEFLPKPEAPIFDVLPQTAKTEFYSLLKFYYNNLVNYYLEYHKRLKRAEERHREFYNTKGDLTERQQTNYEKMVSGFDKLSTNLKM